MRANRVFHLSVRRGGRGPASLAGRDRIDRIEVVSVDDGEPLLYWELPARDAAALLKRLRAELAGTTPEEFLALWEDADAR